MKILKTLICTLIFLPLIPCSSYAHQYLLFHRQMPKSGVVTDNFFTVLADSLGYKNEKNILVGVSVHLNILNDDLDQLAGGVKSLLAASERTSVPVHLNIDGQNWTTARPELWNWWMPDKPGYDPANRENVEWTDWTPDSAIKIAWRDWGTQIRIMPPPNIFSPVIIAEHHKGYEKLLPIIAAWRDNLPANKKHLFAGIRIGWEMGFNYNAYYFENGNELFEKYPDTNEFDPKRREMTADGYARDNFLKVGYAAATYCDIKTTGELNNRDYEYMISLYLTSMCKKAAQYGFTPEEIYTHMGGNYAPFENHLRFWPAINKYSTPGWSFYSLDPNRIESMREDMEANGIRSWGAVEWLWPSSTAAEWEQHIRDAMSFMDCRVLTIYNWDRGMENRPEGLQGIRDLLKKQ